MTRPYSLDLRERVVARVAAGDSCRQVASLFGISVASVVKWAQRKRRTGSAAARPMGRPHGCMLSRERVWLLGRIEAEPDVTLRALLVELAARGLRVSYGTIWNFFTAEGISFKKKPLRQRARPGRRRPKAHPMEEVSGET
jgi:transposase